MALTLDSNTGVVEITDTVIAGLKRKFPTKDVEGELLTAHLWLTRYPKRARRISGGLWITG